MWLVLLFLVFPLSQGISNVDDFLPVERDALIELRETLNSTINLHSIWTGPPCIKNHSRWFGINCLNWHVTSLVLEGVQLSGSLKPDSFKNLTALRRLSFKNNSLFGTLPNFSNHPYLQFLQLSDNQFSGPIPGNFAEIPQLFELQMEGNSLNGTIPPFNQRTLKIFNVSNNLLEGQIPGTPVLQSFPVSSFVGNPGLCGKPLYETCTPSAPTIPITAPPLSPSLPGPPTPFVPPSEGPSKSFEVWGIVLIVVAATLVPLSVMLVFFCYYGRIYRKKSYGEEQGDLPRKGEANSSKSSGGWVNPEKAVVMEFFNQERPIFDLDDLLRASAEIMGRGKLGTTYKAMLETGSTVVVKRLKDMNGLSKKEFFQQMQLLGRLSHPNLVEIISFYYSQDEKLVVYEYLPNGSLFDLLHGNRGPGRVPLQWEDRLRMAKGIAKGLAYLHQACSSHRLPHANLKSSNILLAPDYTPKLTDHGFDPLLPSRRAFDKLAASKAPENAKSKRLTNKTDVWCFGIVLLELISGRVPGQFTLGNEISSEDDLPEWVRSVVNEDWSTDILDLEILNAKNGHGEMLKLTQIALDCTVSALEKRPKMAEVVKRIEEIQEGKEGEGEAQDQAQSRSRGGQGSQQ
ncbi:probable leucine-rich repeat receptor-like protein kinase At1g68400 [Amborella trichopoda]|nr:probable leucine-rich repeat receptor-like protein kinase At1g68400 [Amborella trichopoda]|eukprot:XP_006848637.2 probable leucine-rich repeat receptor-like protein kinase At1g68400 [Amborella trichopoda]